ncbi:hypothetical protein B0H10DRAFT_2223455 [Mycena sp. CBHHK59/15]|nr:hypothetical protein B0H10DRAFT_2223455 [Mycena sp. CBHHK59/15]
MRFALPLLAIAVTLASATPHPRPPRTSDSVAPASTTAAREGPSSTACSRAQSSVADTATGPPAATP